ncbi:uncharacterized protein VTP21DRAFT_1625 [Calcarisporiella thermophila]|uniref:uncharacterized protein n=1 Tax=Calcarisporiella thermophila TaxID=911321 RepID=UPI003744627D
MNYLTNLVSYGLYGAGISILAGGALLYTFQTELIYPSKIPEGSRTHVDLPSSYGMNNFEDLTLTAQDGLKIRAYNIMQPDEEATRNAKTILYLHANAGNMGHRLPIAKEFYNRCGLNVFLLSYRGYGLSEGTPNEKGMMLDAEAALKYIRQHPVLKNTTLILYGQSIGGAVATYLASNFQSQIQGVIIENTFLSLPQLVPNVMPWLRYFTFLCHQVWPSEKYIQQVDQVPVLFLVGSRDEMIPPSHMRRLYALCPSSRKKIVEFPRGTHNDTCIQRGYFDTIVEYLKEL